MSLHVTAFIILPCQPSIVNNFHFPFTSTKLFTSWEEPSLIVESLTTHVDYLAILDFEATCDMDRKLKPQEVIEFPTLLFNVETHDVESIFHQYVRPEINPVLTDYCKDLTGIEQRQVDNGISLLDALKQHQSWLEVLGVSSAAIGEPSSPKRFLYVTFGDWDLKTCLPQQLAYYGQDVPKGFKCWINIEVEFRKMHLLSLKKRRGMPYVLRKLGLELARRQTPFWDR